MTELAEVEERVRGHLGRGDHAAAATEAIRGFGPGIVGWLGSVVRDDDALDEVFSTFCEHLWRAIPQFRGDSSFRTWAHAIAYGALRRWFEDPYRKRRRRLATGVASQLAQEVRSTTALHRRPEAKDKLATLRASLTPDEQTLLILRVDRDLGWREVAEIMAEEGKPADEASLRKRYERLKAKLRKLAEAEGLLPTS